MVMVLLIVSRSSYRELEHKCVIFEEAIFMLYLLIQRLLLQLLYSKTMDLPNERDRSISYNPKTLHQQSQKLEEINKCVIFWPP